MDTDRITGRVKAGVGEAESSYGRWTDDHELHVAGETRRAEGRAEALLGQTKDGVRDAMERALDMSGGAIEAGRRTLQDGAERLNTQVERNPAFAILIAATAGYLLSMLYRSRR